MLFLHSSEVLKFSYVDKKKDFQIPVKCLTKVFLWVQDKEQYAERIIQKL